MTSSYSIQRKSKKTITPTIQQQAQLKGFLAGTVAAVAGFAADIFFVLAIFLLK